MLKFLYNFILTIIYIPFVITVFFRKYINKEHKIKFKEKFLFNRNQRPSGYIFWFHAASIGELNSIQPIIDFYLKKDNKYKFIITTVTLSSYNQFKKKFQNNERVFHQFLPFDLKILVQNFLNNWSPNLVSFVDSEIWPNFIFEIKKRKLPFILLNARITKKTFRRWLFLKSFSFKIFNSFSLCIASSEESGRNLKLLNAKNIKYFGNIKFCVSPEKQTYDDTQFELMKNKKAWVAMSTHEPEESFCLMTHKLIEKTEKNFVTIIIPRHVNRTKKIYESLKNNNVIVQIKNQNDKINENSNIVLVNYYGSTFKYLNRFKQVFIGKSLIHSLKEVGGQNPIEAAKMGCKIYHGPYVYNFQEIYNFLNQNKFADQLEDDLQVSSKTISKKIIEGFNEMDKKNTTIMNVIDNYSKKIFLKVIEEYERYVQ